MHSFDFPLRTTKTAGLLCALLALSACVVAPYPRHGHAVAAEPADGPVVEVAPPAPYAELVSAAPYPGAVWINGYWGWSGQRHQWVPGYWESPRAGYAWRPHVWVQVGGRWQLRGGVWVRP